VNPLKGLVVLHDGVSPSRLLDARRRAGELTEGGLCLREPVGQVEESYQPFDLLGVLRVDDDEGTGGRAMSGSEWEPGDVALVSWPRGAPSSGRGNTVQDDVMIRNAYNAGWIGPFEYVTDADGDFVSFVSRAAVQRREVDACGGVLALLVAEHQEEDDERD
jgi:hypothetical protein